MSENKKILTLCLVLKDDKILLGMKKRGFGMSHWNGFGGKLEAGETIEEAAKRELKEEANLEALDMIKMGILDFEFISNPELILEMHIYKILEFNGEPEETEEMKPQWFSVNEIPFDKMWASDANWYPFIFKDKKFKGKFIFDKPSSADYSAKIINQELFEVEKI